MFFKADRQLSGEPRPEADAVLVIDLCTQARPYNADVHGARACLGGEARLQRLRRADGRSEDDSMASVRLHCWCALPYEIAHPKHRTSSAA
jgi:hypothetical protein